MTTLTAPTPPTAEESKIAAISSQRLAACLNQDLIMQIEGIEDGVELPASVVRLLVDILNNIAKGNIVTLAPIHAVLTTQQAADMIGVSRPFLIKLLEEGTINYHKVGRHRRIRFSDLMDYKTNIDNKRRENLSELAKQAQELNMGYW